MPLTIKTERLTITEIRPSDMDDYARLYLDDELNKWWGYDYRVDLKDRKPTPEYFFEFQKLMIDTKEEVSFAVRLCGKMIGELVLHNFDDEWGVEMGFRFFSDCQGKGYATESALALKDYAKVVLGAKRLKSRCFKENLPSAALIARLGLDKVSESQTRYFFETDCSKLTIE